MWKKCKTLFTPLIIILITFFVVGCNTTDSSIKNDDPNNSSASQISIEDYNFLMGQYTLFYTTYTNLTKSSGTGQDVENAYNACQNIIKTVSDKQIPGNIAYLSTDLIEGITSYSTGFGCFSNKNLCKSDAEATELIAHGKVKLDNFINSINSLTKVFPTQIPTKPLTTSSSNPSASKNITNYCSSWEKISDADVGKTMCVYGTVRNSWYSDSLGAHVIIFSPRVEDFYFVMYGNWTFDNLDKHCVFYTGKVTKVGNTPVIYIPGAASTSIGICDPE